MAGMSPWEMLLRFPRPGLKSSAMMDKTHGLGPLLSSSGCRGLKAAGAAPHAVPPQIGFLWNQTETRWGCGSASGACSPWKNGSVDWIPSPSHSPAGEPCWPHEGLQSPEEQQRDKAGAGSGREGMRHRFVAGLCSVLSVGQSREGFSSLELGDEFKAGMSLVEVQSQVPTLCTPSAFLAAMGFYFGLYKGVGVGFVVRERQPRVVREFPGNLPDIPGTDLGLTPCTTPKSRGISQGSRLKIGSAGAKGLQQTKGKAGTGRC